MTNDEKHLLHNKTLSIGMQKKKKKRFLCILLNNYKLQLKVTGHLGQVENPSIHYLRGCQSITGLTYRDKQPFTPNLTCFWIMGGSWSTWNKSMQTQGQYAHRNPHRKPPGKPGFETGT